MLKLLIYSIIFCLSTHALASGCDSYYLQGGKILNQKTNINYGKLNPDEANELLLQIGKIHSIALFYWTKPPILSSSGNIKLITSTYNDLDTDCGWSKYGKKLSITHLEISTENEILYFPNIYRDVDAEFTGDDEYINIFSND